MSATYYILDPAVVNFNQRSIYKTLEAAQTAASHAMAQIGAKTIDIFVCTLAGTEAAGSGGYTPAS